MTITTITLASLKDALLTPFPMEAIRFLPKSVHEVAWENILHWLPLCE